MSILNPLENKKIAFHTLGCKVNIYESEVMLSEIGKAGAVIVPFTEKADIYVIHTCSVTNMADRKSRQMIHRAKKMNPAALVVACGCYVETEDKTILKETGADLLLGNEAKKDLCGALSRFLTAREETENPDIAGVKVYHPEFLAALSGHTRADIKVQDGCNQFCTYCVIPFARGRIRSKRPEDVVAEITALTECGVKEFVLTGIHLSSYGLDFQTDNGVIADYKAIPGNALNLLSLIQKVHSIQGVERLRIGSLEPRIVTRAFAEGIAALPKVCPHFHLALQSGCDETLKRMNRHYTTEDYLQAVENLRSVYENPAITTDVIVGFPGETEEEFSESEAFFRKIGFFEPNIFPYSRRRGTVADRMKDQVKDEIKKERSDRMLRIGEETSEAFVDSMVGNEVKALTETETSGQRIPKEYGLPEDTPVYQGHTERFLTVLIAGAEKENEICEGRLRKNGETLWIIAGR